METQTAIRQLKGRCSSMNGDGSELFNPFIFSIVEPICGKIAFIFLIQDMIKQRFEKGSRIEAPLENVFRWHTRPGAIERYSPPWDPISLVSRAGGIETGAEVKIRMKAGPVPFLWHALHTDYIENRLFQDVQLKGPFSEWTHTHSFEPLGEEACLLKDTIEFRLPPHPFRDRISNQMVHRQLESVFNYRHAVLAQDLALQQLFSGEKQKTILVSGASGLIASALIPLLTTAGHKVLRLVRTKSNASDAVFWDPYRGVIEFQKLGSVDAVVHLAGEKIGEGRWTDRKKERIISSRVQTTRFLLETVSRLEQPPEVFINASAIGYYGDRGAEILDENADPGTDFISSVCRQWEDQLIPAREAGIRSVNLRIGVVLDPQGGALAELLPFLRLKIGTRVASGRQMVSWLGLNDVAGMIYYLINRTDISGPVNAVTPNAVTNRQLLDELSKLTNGLAVVSIPSPVIKLAFGQMGEEVLLSSTHVEPSVLKRKGFPFRYSSLKPLLRHVLGREQKETP